MPSLLNVPQNALRLNEGQAVVRDYLEVANSPNLSFAGSWTVEAWVATTDSDAQFNRILRMPSGGLQTYSLMVQNGQAKLVAGGTIITGINIADGDYHLLSGVYDSAQNDLILYVDGVEVARNNNVSAPPVSAENLYIGTSNSSLTNQFFDGSIAEVRIWNTARSQGEIIDSAVELDAGHGNLTFALGFNNGGATDYKNGASISDFGETHPESTFFARAGIEDAFDSQDFIGVDVGINGDPGNDAVYTLSSPDGVFFLSDTSDIIILTANGTGEVSFKIGQEVFLVLGGPGKLAPPTNEQIIDNVLAHTLFRPNDGFTGSTTVTFSILGASVDESIELPMVVAPSNSIVNTALDVVDATDGLLSLREAVMLANNGVNSGSITFDPTVFNGEAQDVIHLTGGDIFIDANVLINGDLNEDGTPDVIISGDAFGDDITVNGITNVSASLVGTDRLDDNSRIFTSVNFSIHLNGLTLTGGRTTGDGGSASEHYFAGGAIHSRYSSVYISNSVLSGNSTAGFAAGGGAAFAYGALKLYDTLVTNNSTAGDFALGGGLMSKWASLRLYNSQVVGNSTTGSAADGGGLATYGASIYAVESTIAGNQSAAAGGGIAANGGVYLTSVTVNGNTAAGYGGGIEAGSIVSLVNTTVSGNSSTGGGGLYTSSNAFVTASTFSGNSTTGPTGYGGGARTLGGLYLTDSIVLGNITRDAGVGADEIQAFGGYQFYGHNLVGQNYAAFAASLHSNVDNATAQQVFAATVGNFGISAGVLADNGSVVKTIALKPDPFNPAIDAASGSLPGDQFDLDDDGDFGELLPVDARGDGFLRALGLDGSTAVYGSGRDLGAFEAQGALGLVVTTAADIIDFLDGLVSLREAVILSNQDGFGDFITFDPTVFNGQPANING